MVNIYYIAGSYFTETGQPLNAKTVENIAADYVAENPGRVRVAQAAKLYNVSPRQVLAILRKRATQRRRDALPEGRAKKAAYWYVRTEGASRADAAARWGVSVPAISRALARYVHPDCIPRDRPGLGIPARKRRDPVGKAARWAIKHGATAGMAAVRYGCQVGQVADRMHHICTTQNKC